MTLPLDTAYAEVFHAPRPAVRPSKPAGLCKSATGRGVFRSCVYRNSIPVVCFDARTGKRLASFDSVGIAARLLGMANASIRESVVKGYRAGQYRFVKARQRKKVA